jgi:hypothetical protein
LKKTGSSDPVFFWISFTYPKKVLGTGYQELGKTRSGFSREKRERRKYILIIETFRAIGVICGKKQPAGRK